MRHLVSVVLAIVMAAAVFFAASWGYLKLLTGSGRFGTLPAGGGSLLHDRTVVEGFGALLAVGLVAGILIAVPRISPLASGLPGLVLLAWTGLYLYSARRAVQYIPLKTRVYGSGFEDMLFDGVLALAGLAMIIPLFVPSRWRGRVVAVAPAADHGDGYADSQPTHTNATDNAFTSSDWSATATRPQQRLEPNNPNAQSQSQAPWGPADYS
jgi:hypothetical protein